MASGNNDDLKRELERLQAEVTPGNDDDVKKEIERLRAENETLKQTKSDNISFKVGQKGGMSMYGLARFPVTLYKSQWLILLSATDKIRTFLKDHDHGTKVNFE